MNRTSRVNRGDVVQGKEFLEVFDQSTGFGVEEMTGLGVAVEEEDF